MMASPEAIQATIDTVDRLLGKGFQKVWNSYERVRKGGFRPSNPHRLAELRWIAMESISMAAASEMLDYDALSEFRTAARIFLKYSKEKQWPCIVRSMLSPDDYRHEFAVLALAVEIEQHGIKVNLKDGEEIRSPDAILTLPGAIDTWVEVKAPRVLQGHRPALTSAEIAELIESAFRSAETNLGGQLPPDAPGILVIGAYFLPEVAMERLIQAALKSIDRWRRFRPHVVHIGYVLVTSSVSPVVRMIEDPVTRRLQPHDSQQSKNCDSLREAPGDHRIDNP
jgi:hypothetical protein